MRLAIVALLCTTGCERPYLTWSPREPLSARRGKLAVTVDDRRADPSSLGRAFGWGGAPREILVPPTHARDRLSRLAREAAVTAGLGLAEPAEPPSARLSIALTALRCDGLARMARAELAITYSIDAPDGTPRVAAETIALRGTAAGCQAALGEALDGLLDELAARLVDGPAHDAAL